MSAELSSGRLLVLRGPMGSGKTTVSRLLSRKPPYWFVHLRSDAPPCHVERPDLRERRVLQLAMWARWTRALIEEGQNTLLDCDLQTRAEADQLAQGAGVQWPGDRMIMIRLSVSEGGAVRRLPGRNPSEVSRFHAAWGAPSISGEFHADTEDKTPDGVAAFLREELARRWPG